tara:strand:- start:193 stop:672 length:480 start_codon:yes stop_codon:yes gene_type:complete
MEKILTIKKFYLLIFLISTISLLGAVFIENILEQSPCRLCLYQRIPYLISIFICFFGFNYYKNFLWMYLLLILFIISAILSGYHVGIENSIFEEFSGCTSENINITNKLDLLNNLKKTMPSCKNVDFKLFGLSLATINLIISLIISAISITLIKYEKNK